MKYVIIGVLAFVAAILENSFFRALPRPLDAMPLVLSTLLIIAVTSEIATTFVFASLAAFFSALMRFDGTIWLLLILPLLGFGIRAFYQLFFTRLTFLGILATALVGTLVYEAGVLVIQAPTLVIEWERVDLRVVAVQTGARLVFTVLLMSVASFFYNRLVLHRETAYLGR